MERQTPLNPARRWPGPLRALALTVLVGALAGCASAPSQSLRLDEIAAAEDADTAGPDVSLTLRHALPGAGGDGVVPGDFAAGAKSGVECAIGNS